MIKCNEGHVIGLERMVFVFDWKTKQLFVDYFCEECQLHYSRLIFRINI